MQGAVPDKFDKVRCVRRSAASFSSARGSARRGRAVHTDQRRLPDSTREREPASRLPSERCEMIERWLFMFRVGIGETG